jgi:methylthioribose-1-phosphate isomerase
MRYCPDVSHGVYMSTQHLCDSGVYVAQEKILLHGSTGALATGGFGVSLGAIKTAKANGKAVSIVIAEARPDMAGGRVGAYEALKRYAAPLPYPPRV